MSLTPEQTSYLEQQIVLQASKLGSVPIDPISLLSVVGVILKLTDDQQLDMNKKYFSVVVF